MNSFACRVFQCCFGAGARLLPWRTPEVYTGDGSLLRVAGILRENSLRHPFVIASRRQCADEHFRRLQEVLDMQDILLSIFSAVEPNPSVETVEKIAEQYRIDRCDCFLVIGGGSPMDAAKAAAALLVRPNRSLSSLAGLLKVRRRIPPFIAVPTTAGTGSETTIAAVITGRDHRKYAVSDLCLIPRYAILDPTLSAGLPPHITAETGMDALTHAVEAYCNRFCSPKMKAHAMKAVSLIGANLLTAYREPANKAARMNMLTGSYEAGIAFTNAYVGYVHAIAHGIGGLYHVPHGEANAILLPKVLAAYGSAVYEPLARLERKVRAAWGKPEREVRMSGAEPEREVRMSGAGMERKVCASGAEDGNSKETDAVLAEAFIERIRRMNRSMGIPEQLAMLRKEDVPELAARALKEGNPNYPVPVIWEEEQMRAFLMEQVPK